MRRAALVVAVVVLAGCAGRKPLPQPPPARAVSGPRYVDLVPGGRVTVVTPILKSGKFLLQTGEAKEEGNTITLRVGDEFQGYETAVYLVGEGARITVGEVKVNKGGVETAVAKPFAPRLRVPGRMRHVRLLFTLKVSDADHNMAVLAARDPGRLGALTGRVEADPAGACRTTRNEYCEWVPAGVAVRPNSTR